MADLTARNDALNKTNEEVTARNDALTNTNERLSKNHKDLCEFIQANQELRHGNISPPTTTQTTSKKNWNTETERAIGSAKSNVDSEKIDDGNNYEGTYTDALMRSSPCRLVDHGGKKNANDDIFFPEVADRPTNQARYGPAVNKVNPLDDAKSKQLTICDISPGQEESWKKKSGTFIEAITEEYHRLLRSETIMSVHLLVCISNSLQFSFCG